VFNSLGRKVRSPVDWDLRAGRHWVTWDGLDDRGRDAGSAVFIAVLTDGTNTSSRKWMKLK
jgi:hypothetical protein